VKSGSEQTRSLTDISVTIKLSLAAFIVLNVIDGIFTKSLLAAGEYEFNPIMSLSGWAFWAVKLGMTAIVTLGLLFFQPRFPRQVKRILKGFVVGMVVICLFNLAAFMSAGAPLSSPFQPNEPMTNGGMATFSLNDTEIRDPEIALQYGITGYLEIIHPSDPPSPLSVDRGGEINITILLHFVSYSPEVTEAQLNIDANPKTGGTGIQGDGVFFNDLVSYNPSGNITIKAGDTIPVTMSFHIPENFPSSIEALPLSGMGIAMGITTKPTFFPIVGEFAEMENEVAIH
jgi:hypothetical protein